jgi:hypothetical protein
MRHALLPFALAFILVSPMTIEAGTLACRQDNSVYLERGSGAELRFRPNAYGAATYFMAELTLASGQVFEGAVEWGNGFSVPSGSLRDTSCDAVDELTCFGWGALVYRLTPGGVIDLISGAEPAPQVLMPELMARLFFFAKGNALEWEVPRSDTYFFQHCGDGTAPDR